MSRARKRASHLLVLVPLLTAATGLLATSPSWAVVHCNRATAGRDKPRHSRVWFHGLGHFMWLPRFTVATSRA
jgi:hypothetical protein